MSGSVASWSVLLVRHGSGDSYVPLQEPGKPHFSSARQTSLSARVQLSISSISRGSGDSRPASDLSPALSLPATLHVTPHVMQRNLGWREGLILSRVPH